MATSERGTGRMVDSAVWYTRKRNGEIGGPYPARLVRRYLLLGRLTQEDEISPDGHAWQCLAERSDLMPPELYDVDTPEGRERLLQARLREDERTGRDRRRRGSDAPEAERRRGPDRRQREEPEAMTRYRRLRASTSAPQLRQRANTWAQLSGIGLAAAALIALLLTLPPPENKGTGPKCGAAPEPGINWNNCQLGGAALSQAKLIEAQLRSANLAGARLSGADLHGADAAYASFHGADLRDAALAGANLTGAVLRNARLTDADLRGANLAFADLSGARLSGAQLAEARLDRTIWTDGSVCAPGSVGECRSWPEDRPAQSTRAMPVPPSR